MLLPESVYDGIGLYCVFCAGEVIGMARPAHHQLPQTVISFKLQPESLKPLVAVTPRLVQCDDLALLERETAGIGDVFMDASFNESRSPRYLRRCVRDIMRDAGLEPTPVMHSWAPVKRQYT